MPQHKSAEKRIRQTERRRVRNVAKRSRMRTAIKKVRNATDKETAVNELQKTYALLDRLAVKGIIHRNKAANIKSSLVRKVNSLS